MSGSECCPFCGSEYLNMMGYNFNKVCCSNVNCYIYGVAFIKEDWITRAPQSEWISVEDKLPEQGDVVLCKCNDIVNGWKEVLTYNGYWMHKDENRVFTYYPAIVTEWMYIPE